ncbi:MAG: 4-hydroxy-tetrahydrodipicolinate reductase [Bacteroidales bacterium]|nr:4-hydroxy-tetrahydrodipicolinate reductase [Bacteroidales bacterium]
MNLVIIGYGKMGKEIERVALERNHNIVARIDGEKDWETHSAALKEAAVAIDFSTAHSAADNIRRCFKLGLPVVCGTTGWLDQLIDIKNDCAQNEQAFFYAPNFSVGVNLFFEVNKSLAQLMNVRPEYEVAIEEIHHEMKTDAPSGTAIKLAEDIVAQMNRKKGWAHKAQANMGEIGIESVRVGAEPGTHIVSYESLFDVIEIKHTAKNRRGFAIGAIMAAEWMEGKKGFYGMKDMLLSKYK